MVRAVTIGIIGVQGAISEHVAALNNALEETTIQGRVTVVKQKKDIHSLDAIVIPGGESTTISKFLHQADLYTVISKKIREDNLPVMGTCAGCVLLARKLTNKAKNDIPLLSAMDMQVRRNAFGRQRESFEQPVNIKGFSSPFHAVFIRAPVIEKIWGECEALAKLDEKVVMARQRNLLAVSFHPELTDDTRVHKYFLDLI
jgi:5'-phosphate synthase pdxT subunit